MKIKNKKLIIPLVLGSIAAVSSIVSLAVCLGVKQKSEEQYQTKLQKAHSLLSPEYENLIDSFFNQDTSQAAQYAFSQKQISTAHIQDLKLALSFFNPHRTKGYDDAQKGDLNFNKRYKRTRIRSRDQLFSSMTTDWLWTLLNINKFEFLFNPYGHDGYRWFKGEEELFVQNKTQIKTTIQQIDNRQIALFDTNQLPKGHFYNFIGVDQTIDKIDMVKRVYNLNNDQRLINKVYMYENDHLNLYVDIANEKINQPIYIDFKDQQNHIITQAMHQEQNFLSLDLTNTQLDKNKRYEVVSLYTIDAKNQKKYLNKYLSAMHFQAFTINDLIFQIKNTKHEEFLKFDLTHDTNLGDSELFQNYHVGDEVTGIFEIWNENNNVISINDTTYNEIYEYKWEHTPDDFYQEKSVYYMVYDHNKIMRLTKLKDDQELFYGRLDWDLFVFDHEIQHDELVNFANTFEQKTKALYDQEFNDELQGIYDEIDEYGYTTDPDQIAKIKKNERDNLRKEFEQSNYHFNLKPRMLTYNYQVAQELQQTTPFKIYTLRSVKADIFLDTIEPKDKQVITKKETKIPEFLSKYNNHDLDVVSKNESVEQRISKEIIKSLLNEIYDYDSVLINDYVKEQNDPEYQANLIAELKAYAKEYHKKFDQPANPEDKTIFDSRADAYSKLLSKNWYFVFTHLEHFEFLFVDWFKLPTNLDTGAHHSEEYLTNLSLSAPYKPFRFGDHIYEELKETDVSKAHNSDALSRELMLKKNNSLFWFNIYTKNKINNNMGIKLYPYTLTFKSSKLSISISTLTNNFHLSYIHGDQRHYDIFEKKLVKQYGLPAKMVMVWKD
ncbi:hypothetical protein OF376_00270 [Ureaplasma miroungigenitalium]|uniref:DUF31 domain-containing protein n=1 Tax=Ureaplasma miroungigenitalium TaxID=1042321 RepID=A0ABT3BLU3_9BACT|nr:aromatic motif membrane protein [Ureaplasma miroungigenitalium]MCV3728225.1 hypothetical protein [Ureaplasma miroungigenitalium]MCV3734029.1 hypothetical protein [Ureaplasma miroungigenitalium]